MFGRKKTDAPLTDTRSNPKKTIFGGTKTVHAAAVEGTKANKEVLKANPKRKSIVNKREEYEPDWIDRLEELDAIFDDD